ncbi:MAG: hypothetical protein AB2L21_04250 [Anaerolineaceae bacterium]
MFITSRIMYKAISVLGMAGNVPPASWGLRHSMVLARESSGK